MSLSTLRVRGRVLPRAFAGVNWHQPHRRCFAEQLGLETAKTRPGSQVEKILLDSIKATGPISFATYMQTCLTFPEHGYYTNSDHPVFGARGDFITSPEISQVFGELIGIWFLSQWKNAGMPRKIRLVELGPGRGTLMDDILRVVSQFALQSEKTSDKGGPTLEEIHLVEASRVMRKIQEDKLRPFSDKIGCRLEWHDDLYTISSSGCFTMVVAHEFFDALPFYLLQKVGNDDWREVMIASASDPITDPRSERNEAAPASPMPVDNKNQHKSQVDPLKDQPLFRRVLSPGPKSSSIIAGNLSKRYADLSIGSFVEVSVKAYSNAIHLAKLLGVSQEIQPEQQNQQSEAVPPNGGGCGLIIDYGDAKAFGNSFRAFKNHKIVDVFHQPGKSDLTTNVDFALLSEAMEGFVTKHGPISQADFLQRMGLGLRVQTLASRAEGPDRRQAIVDAARRLVDPTGMGKEYKVFGFTSFRNGTPEVYPFDKSES